MEKIESQTELVLHGHCPTRQLNSLLSRICASIYLKYLFVLKPHQFRFDDVHSLLQIGANTKHTKVLQQTRWIRILLVASLEVG